MTLTYNELKKPLLIITKPKGFLACGYINPETCNATQEACAIVRGVNSLDDMRTAKIVAASEAAEQLGIRVGVTGQDALDAFE